MLKALIMSLIMMLPVYSQYNYMYYYYNSTAAGGSSTPSAPVLPVTENLDFDYDMDVATTSGVVDASVNNRNMTFENSATVLTADLNGYNTVSFNGSTQSGYIADRNLAQPMTIYAVIKIKSYADYERLWDNSTYGNGIFGFWSPSSTTSVYMGSYFNVSDVSLFGGNTTDYQLVVIVYNSASTLIDVSDVAKTGNPGAGSSAGFRIAARNYPVGSGSDQQSDINVARLLRYAGAHDEATRTSIKNYLKTLYGL